jgi:hypothetical protein
MFRNQALEKWAFGHPYRKTKEQQMRDKSIKCTEFEKGINFCLAFKFASRVRAIE